MKRLLAMVLAVALAIPMMTTVAFAKAGDPGKPSGEAEFDDGYEVSPGDTIELDESWFYGKWTEREDGERHTYEESPGSLDSEFHKVSATWTRGGEYIEDVYFEDGDSYVTIEIKGGITTTSDKEIAGTVKILLKDFPNMPNVTYTCKINRGDVVIKGIDEKSRMVYLDDKEFGLPDDYQEKQVRFVTEDGDEYGTFIGEFYGERSGQDVATYRVRIIDQKSLYLGFSEASNSTLQKKYPNADLRFINWTARPTFDQAGKLSIYMDPEEYIYGVNDDNTLYRLGGTYDEDNDAYVISTKTLGCSVISDTALTASGSGSGGNTTVTKPSSSSTAPKPSSSVAPPPSSSTVLKPSSSVAPPPSSSSVAPPPSSSSVAPPSSSSVAPPPSSSSEEEDPEDEESSDPADNEDDDKDDEDDKKDKDKDKDKDDKDDEDDEDEDKKEKKGFPLVPVLLGVLGIVIIVCAVVVVGNRTGGSQRSRRRRYDDDWDD